MQITRRKLLETVSSTALVLGFSGGSFAWVLHGKNSLEVTWNASTINGGGTMPGFSFASDGTKLVRTDIAGAYKWDGTKWNQICAQFNNGRTQLPYAIGGYHELYGGITEIQVANSNTSVIYVIIQDVLANNQTNGGGAFIYKSIDGGATFNNTNWPMHSGRSVSGDPTLYGVNTDYKWTRNKLGVDPANENVVYACNSNGTYPLVTMDGGVTWNSVPNLPISASNALGAACWAFDTSQGTTVVNGVTVSKYIYVAVEANGVWQSVDGGVSFSQIVSWPTASYVPCYCDMSFDGVYYLTYADGSNCRLGRYKSGVWSSSLKNIATSSFHAGVVLPIASHPTAAGVLVVFYSGNSSPCIYQSTDYGDTFPSSINKRSVTFSSVTDSPWYANQLNGAFAMQTNMCIFDPASANDLYVSWGQGLCKTTLAGTPPQISATPTFTGINNGIENAVCNCLVHESGGKLLQVMADIVGFVKDTSALGTPPSALLNVGASPNSTPFIRASGWQGAIDPFNTNNMVITADRNTHELMVCGYSNDGGSTWQAFPSIPPSAGNGVAPALATATSCTISGRALTIGGTVVGTISVGRNVNGTGVTPGTYISGGSSPNFTVSPSQGPIGPIALGFGGLGAVVPLSIMISNGVILWQSFPSYIWYRSTDWGVTWTATNITTAGVSLSTGWGANYLSVPGSNGCVDRVNPNKMYITNATHGASPACKGIWISTNAGQSFSYQGTSSDPYFSSGQPINFIKALPGVEGHLFLSSGYISTGGYPHPQRQQGGFWYSTDGGAHWTQIPNMYEIVFGFGKAGPYGNATLFCVGFNKGNYGVWMSTNLGATFTQLISSQYENWPRWNDVVQWVEGDKDVYGRCYLGFQGSGAIYSTLV